MLGANPLGWAYPADGYAGTVAGGGGGTTHTDAGTGASDLDASGGVLLTHPDTGTGTSDADASGAALLTHPDTGTGASDLDASGSEIGTYNRTGTGIMGTGASGAIVHTTKSGDQGGDYWSPPTYKPKPIRQSAAVTIKARLSGVGRIVEAPRFDVRQAGVLSLIVPVLDGYGRVRTPASAIPEPMPPAPSLVALPHYRNNQPTFPATEAEVRQGWNDTVRSIARAENAQVATAVARTWLENADHSLRSTMTAAAVLWADRAEGIATAKLIDAGLTVPEWVQPDRLTFGSTGLVENMLPQAAVLAARTIKTTQHLAHAAARSDRVMNQRTVQAVLERGMGPLAWQAVVNARTNIERAGREGFRAWAAANSEHVVGWQWATDLSTEACPACFAMHGSIHTPDDDLNDHPYGTCQMDPLVAGVEPDEIDSEELFGRLPEGDQAAILGPTLYEMYANDDVTLAELVELHDHQEYGRWVGVTPLSRLD